MAYDANKDKAELWDHYIHETGCYVTFYTGRNGNGSALRQTLYREKWDHNDGRLHAMAERKAKELGAYSWAVFKPVGILHNVFYNSEEEIALGRDD